MLKLGVGDTIRAGADALEAGIRSEAIETQQQAPPQRVRIKNHAVAGAHKRVEEPRPCRRLRHDVDQLGHRPASLELRLDRDRRWRRRQRLERRDRDPVLAAPQDAHLRIERDGVVEPGQRIRQLRPQSHAEGTRVRVSAKLAVILRAPLLEVSRQILVGVPVFCRAGHPDLLAPQPLAQRRQHADFIVDAVDLGIPLTVLLQHEIVPFRRDDVLNGNTFVQAHNAPAILMKALQPADRLDHRPVHRVV